MPSLPQYDAEAESITASLMDHACLSHSNNTVAKITKRCQALITELILIQVDTEEIVSPISSIISSKVIDAFSKIGGDFNHVLPFALLEARRYFKKEELRNPADAGENECRRLAAEVLARRIVQRLPLSDQYAVLSARYTLADKDTSLYDSFYNGSDELATSALESAVDQQCYFFLSSSESQRVTFALWKGTLEQTQRDDGSIVYRPHEYKRGGFFDHFDAARLGVPRYQFILRIALWILFIFAYSTAIVVDKSFGIEDVILYTQLLGYIIEEMVTIVKLRSFSAFGFWTWINFIIFSLMGIAFGYRVAEMWTLDHHLSAQYRMLSFQFLSSAAPLLYMKLMTIFDVYPFFGMAQIVLRRMLKESAIFFVLLTLLAAGFAQSLLGLDAADGTRDSTDAIINSLIQGLLGSSNFALYQQGTVSYPFGLVIYYSWCILTLVLLLNILIALFGSAYSDAVSSATEVYMTFFAQKTIKAIRAPDRYVYVAPFNLVEMFVAPWEYVVSRKTYARINRVVMSILFFLPLCFISVYETHFDMTREKEYAALLASPQVYSSQDEDPEVNATDGEPEGMLIGRVKFEDLKAELPDLSKTGISMILDQLALMRQEMQDLKKENSDLMKILVERR